MPETVPPAPPPPAPPGGEDPRRANDLSRGRLHREARTLAAMIAITCHDLHGGRRRALCASCAELAAYAEHRLLLCPFGQGKPTCARCPVHCYRPEMRERVRQVMRHAGPTMLRRHPIQTLIHLVFDSHRPTPERPRPSARRAARAPLIDR